MVSMVPTELIDGTIVDTTEKFDVSDIAQTEEIPTTVEEGREPPAQPDKEETNDVPVGRFNFRMNMNWRAGNLLRGRYENKVDEDNKEVSEKDIVNPNRESRRDNFTSEAGSTHEEIRVKGSLASYSAVTDERPVALEDSATSTDGSPHRFRWFGRQQIQEVGIDSSTIQNLDDRAEVNEGRQDENIKGGFSLNQGARPNRLWRMFGRMQPEYQAGKAERTAANDHYSPSNSASISTELVIQTEYVNSLWSVLRRSMMGNDVWQPTISNYQKTRQTSTSNSGTAGSWRNPFRRQQAAKPNEVQTNDDKNGTTNAPRTRRWGFWENWSNRNRGQQASTSAENSEEGREVTSTALVNYEASVQALRKAMKKASVAVGGGCMVVIGVPLLLFPVPGPGVAMIASGVYVISSEFEFARNWLENVENRFGNVLNQLGIEIGDAPGVALSTPKLNSEALECSPTQALPSPSEETRDGDEGPVLLQGESTRDTPSLEEVKSVTSSNELDIPKSKSAESGIVDSFGVTSSVEEREPTSSNDDLNGTIASIYSPIEILEKSDIAISEAESSTSEQEKELCY